MIKMTYTYIYKENYSDKIYKEFYNFFDKKVNKLLKDLSNTNPKDEFQAFEYSYEVWIEDTFEEAIEATGFSIECEELAIDFHEDLCEAFSILDEETEWHNERALELQYNER